MAILIATPFSTWSKIIELFESTTSDVISTDVAIILVAVILVEFKSGIITGWVPP